MKTRKFLSVMSVLAVLATSNLSAQSPGTIDSGLSSTTYVTNLESLVVSGSAVRVDPYKYPDLLCQVAFKLTTTSYTLGVSNVVFYFNTSIDNGATYSTDFPLSITATANTNVLVYHQGWLSKPTTSASSASTSVVATTATNTTSTATITTEATTPTIYQGITHIKLGKIRNYNGLNVTNIVVTYRPIATRPTL